MQDADTRDRSGGARPGGETRIQAARRNELVEAAIAVISEYGLSQLTLAKVAGRAGLTAAMVNFHFRNKSELLLATLRSLSREFKERIEAAVAAAPADPRAKLEAFIDANFDPALSDPRKVAVWYAFWGESQARADYQQACGEMDLAYDRLATGLFAAAGAGSGAGLDAEALAQGLLGVIEGQWQSLLAAPAAFDRAAARALCRRYLDSVLPRPPESERRPAAPAAPAAGARLGLAAWTYRNAALFAAECESLHLPGWQPVCHVAQVARAGDALSFDFLGRRAFVVRGEDGAVRAFHNVCRHRAHAVVPDGASACPGVIRCPYHGWTYGLDGRLKAVPGASGFADLDRAGLDLLPVDCEVFQGLVFVRFAAGGAPVAERLGPYAEELARYRIPEMEPIGGPWEREVEADWKTIWDNFLEGYHFATAHPGLSALTEREYHAEARAGEKVARLWHALRAEPARGWSVRGYAKLLPDYPHLGAELARSWRYYFLFPGLALDVYPDLIDVFHVVPLAPGRSLLRSHAFALPDARREARAARWLNRRINREVQREDDALTAAVQRGLASQAYERGPLSEPEAVLAAFQGWIVEVLPAAGRDRPPPEGR